MKRVALQMVVYGKQDRERSGADRYVLGSSMDSYTRGESLVDVLADEDGLVGR